jgi:hypothetical protein
MTHLQLYNRLKEVFSPDTPDLPLIDDLILQILDFVSSGPRWQGQNLLEPPKELEKLLPPGTDLSTLFVVPDNEIIENKKFRYHIIKPASSLKSSKAIILLHGFNERFWDKYLPIAARLANKTSKSVILFPIAFHMNRSPALWNNSRIMHKVSHWRKSNYPNILESSLSNVAISIRIHNDPSRFFWSGLESYENIISLVKSIRLGQHPTFTKDTSVDFFTYSIGSFLGEILMLTNQESLFDQSRLVTFCGGPVLNRLSPVSKFILDSEADVCLYSFFIEHLESHRRTDSNLEEFLGSPGVGANFRAMLNYRLDLEYREDRFRSMANRIKALALAKDQVVPPFEVINTLKGSQRDTGVDVSVVDPTYPYRHEDPFPTSPKYEGQVDEWFERIIGDLCDFLK